MPETLNERASKCMGWTYAGGECFTREDEMLGEVTTYYDPERFLDDAALVRDKAIEVCGWNDYFSYLITVTNNDPNHPSMVNRACLATPAQITEASCRCLEAHNA